MGTTIHALVLAAVLSTAACASGSDIEPAARRGPASATAVDVSNHNWLDVTVYAVVQGRRDRLGTVSSLDQAELDLPRNVALGGEPVQFLLEPIGTADSYLTPPVQTFGARGIRLQIENQLRQSTVTAR